MINKIYVIIIIKNRKFIVSINSIYHNIISAHIYIQYFYSFYFPINVDSD